MAVSESKMEVEFGISLIIPTITALPTLVGLTESLLITMTRVLQSGVILDHQIPNWVPDEPLSMLPIPKDRVATQECVGEQVTNKIG